jgi:hypothetical protein
LNNDYGRDVLLQAINGNATAISQLSTTLNCDINAVQAALNSLGTQIQSVGNQVGLTGQQIINSIQSGNCQITSQLASCCCDVKNLVTTQGYENRIANAENTAAIINKIDAQTNMINDKFCALEMREMQNKIDALREKNSEQAVVINNAQQTATFNQMLNSYTAPIAAAVNTLQTEIAGVKCRLPETVTLPYSCATAVPTNALYAGWSFGPNFNAYSGCGCNNSLWG